MKKLKISWIKVISIVLMCGISFYTLTFGIKRATDFEIYKKPTISTKIYNVWHIETFEGGGKARISYLNNVARKLEKENPGVLFAVKQIEPSKLENLIATQTPDIISFGYGVGKIILPHLIELDSTFDIRDELVESGTFNNKLYALAYIVSGYAFFEHGGNNENFLCGTNSYTKPENIYNDLNLTPAKQQSQYQAYQDFVNTKNTKLLGTARDVFRVENLNNIGRISASILPVKTYTDLIQYIGVSTLDENSKLFLKTALSFDYQSTLTQYSLFSSSYNKLYSLGIYNDMENAILNCKIAKVFDD